MKPIKIEQVSLSNAHGRIIAQDIISSMNIPSFTRSTVDGYAVKADETFQASENKPVCLKYSGQVEIGESPKVVLKKGLIAEIVTGAPIPE
ncbi:molybdopterin molybdenumtransferase MoeA, partial [Candidatus Bathyarchaeota archaeon]|nr:molybdopterin molybdenumtransferase MoeA [Candidatus Bathyarchaeota archaeon]